MKSSACRLIVHGPSDYDDREQVFDIPDKYTEKFSDVTLIAGVVPGKEYHIHCSYFPLAAEWLSKRRRKYGAREGDKTRFSIVELYFPPGEGKDKWTTGVKTQIKETVRTATHLVHFWNVGEEEQVDKLLWRYSELYDLQRKKVLL